MKRITVLVADDEPEVRDVLRALISTDEGLRLVGAVEEAEDAIEIATQRQPDIALVDVRMPGGGGVRATREIVRRSPPTKVIAFSAFEDVETVLSMLRAGARFYVSKADSTDEILRTIHRAAEGAADEGDTDIERVVVALDEWRAYRHEHASLDELRTARVEEVLQAGGMTVNLAPVRQLASGEVVGWEAFPSFPAGGRSAAILADARSVGMLKQLELAFAELALGELSNVAGNQWLAIGVSSETARSAQLLALLDGVDTGRVVLQLDDPNPVFDRIGVERAIHLWRGAGARTAIRDVGCGAETLRLFVRVRPDFVLLDPSLTSHLDGEAPRERLVRALVAIASDLGSTAIASTFSSGMDTAALAELGVELGVDDMERVAAEAAHLATREERA